MVSFGNSQDKANSVVLNFLQFVYEIARTARQERIAVVKEGKNKDRNKNRFQEQKTSMRLKTKKRIDPYTFCTLAALFIQYTFPWDRRKH